VATAKTSPDAWIEAALRALTQGGPDAVRIETLAMSLGVTKGGFYWHFADRRALLDRMLDSWERSVVDDVIALLEGEPCDARSRLRQLFDLARARASSDYFLAAEPAIRDWARRDPAVADRLHRVDERRMAYVRSLFRQISLDDDDAEARSLLAFALFVGSNFIAVGHDGRTRAAVIEHALDRLLSSSWH
jgi:AcrR family transcriptional regulator